MSVQLLVVQGKQRGQFLNFPNGEFVFGRGPECHIRPNSDWISRQHCILVVDHNNALIRDLGSTNGTLVNGSRVIGELALRNGDNVQLGPLVLQILINPDLDTQTPTIPDSMLRLGDAMGETHIIDEKK